MLEIGAWIMFVVSIGLHTEDVLLTNQMLATGKVHEDNPIGLWLMDHLGPLYFLPAKAIAVIIPLGAWWMTGDMGLIMTSFISAVWAGVAVIHNMSLKT
jgi:hypothetical protein